MVLEDLQQEPVNTRLGGTGDHTSVQRDQAIAKVNIAMLLHFLYKPM